MKRVLSLAAALGSVVAQYDTVNTSLPVVDLGYEIYRAASYNVSLLLHTQ